MAKKDKVRKENIDVDQSVLELFFTIGGEEGYSKDYTIIEKAYRGLNAEYFEAFLQLAQDKGTDLLAKNPQGFTMLDIIKQHANGADYVAIYEDFLE